MFSKIINYAQNHSRTCWIIFSIVLLLPTPAYAAVPLLLGGAAAAAGLASVYYFFPEIVAIIGSTILNLTGFLLTLSGLIFNWLVEYTIIGFGQTLISLQMIGAITQVWEAFRDIGNIVIIGMFVFVAISTILGIDEYGAKKLISRLLIVAVLINFSLFFTKAVIDASHITANQFYNSIAAAAQPNAEPGSVQNDKDAKESLRESGGISGAFMQRLGITGLWDNYETLKQSASANGGWFVLAYSLAGATLILIVAAILLYGSFLLASRAVLLVFLMITSSLAFASYLIPKFSTGKYGWVGWWDTLLKSALMAPLLMIFLWASLFILQGAPGARSGSIGEFLGNPGNENNWQVVVIFIFTAGFLFLSIKLSKTLSSNITGFQISSKIPGLGLLAASRFAGFAARNTIGRGAAAAHRQLGNIKKPNAFQRATMRRMNDLGKSSFDAMNVKKLRTGLKDIAGFKDVKEDVGKDGRFGALERKAERGIKEAAKEAPSAAQQEDVKKAAIKESKEANANEYNNAASDKGGSQQVLEKALQEQDQIQSQNAQALEQLTTNFINAQNEGQRAQAETALKDRKDQIGLTAIQTRIEKARKQIGEADKAVSRLDAEAEAAGKEVTMAYDERALASAQHATHRRASRLWGVIGSPKTDPAVQQVAGIMKKKKGEASLKGIFKDYANTGTPPPPPPPAGGASTGP